MKGVKNIIMPRVHFVKKAQKDNPVANKGESYYWWKFRYGGKRYSRVYPSRSSLTQSAFLQALYDIEDNLDGNFYSEMSRDDLNDARQNLVDSINDMLADCETSLENMPEQLQESSASGEMLQNRIDSLNDWLNNIEFVDIEDQDVSDAVEEILFTNYEGE